MVSFFGGIGGLIYLSNCSRLDIHCFLLNYYKISSIEDRRSGSFIRKHNKIVETNRNQLIISQFQMAMIENVFMKIDLSVNKKNVRC